MRVSLLSFRAVEGEVGRVELAEGQCFDLRAREIAPEQLSRFATVLKSSSGRHQNLPSLKYEMGGDWSVGDSWWGDQYRGGLASGKEASEKARSRSEEVATVHTQTKSTSRDKSRF